jgi:hypothetical protein
MSFETKIMRPGQGSPDIAFNRCRKSPATSYCVIQIAQIVNPSRRVDQDHEICGDSADRSSSSSPAQPTPLRLWRNSRGNGRPTSRRNAKSTASRLVRTPYRRITSAMSSSSSSMLVRLIHQRCTCSHVGGAAHTRFLEPAASIHGPDLDRTRRAHSAWRSSGGRLAPAVGICQRGGRPSGCC